MKKAMPMCDDVQVKLPEILEEDIVQASRLMGLDDDAFTGEDGTDPRKEVFQSMETIDVAACPGSGKTTLLVAKLAALAEKWSFATRGICVLSHTNVARNEIETRLGRTRAGQRLLSYPHFIGTIHGFVDGFLALPWLRSCGYPIMVINTEIVQRRRWRSLSSPIRTRLEENRHKPTILEIKSPGCSMGDIRWGRGMLSSETEAHKALVAACRQSVEEGYFCFSEMFVWANELIDKQPLAIQAIRNRFPLLFIDEAQDNSEEQSSMLYKVFMEGPNPVIRQRFGDDNQAIFHSFSNTTAAVTDTFPTSEIKKELPSSHRFGQKIAALADPLGLSPYPEGLKGVGPKKCLSSGNPDCSHTVFLFDDESVTKVLDAYGELLIETFSEDELREGSFIAAGMVHKPNYGSGKRPHCIGHYWHEYNHKVSKSEPALDTFNEHVLAGNAKADAMGETSPAVEKTAEGILRLAELIDNSFSFTRRRSAHRCILELLEAESEMLQEYEAMLVGFFVNGNLPTQETWNPRWQEAVKRIALSITGKSSLTPEADDFLEWNNGGECETVPCDPSQRGNIYRFSMSGKEVAIRLGSIHSVKGETHTATLVTETFWYTYNLKSIMKWLCGKEKGSSAGTGSQNKTRLKLHYVAMTRPTHLLCLAMRKDSLTSNDENSFREFGWNVDHIKAIC